MRVCFVLALALTFAGFARTAHACSCGRPSLRSALESATVVADMRLLEVRPLHGPWAGSQYMLYRVERIYKAPPTLTEGDEVWLVHETCTSEPYDTREVGGRRIWFMSAYGAHLTHGYCSPSLSSFEPIPHVLLEARARWRASRR